MNYLKNHQSAKTDQGDKLRNRKIKKICDSTEVHRKGIAILKQSLSLTRWIATLYAISIPVFERDRNDTTFMYNKKNLLTNSVFLRYLQSVNFLGDFFREARLTKIIPDFRFNLFFRCRTL